MHALVEHEVTPSDARSKNDYFSPITSYTGLMYLKDKSHFHVFVEICEAGMPTFRLSIQV